MSKYFSSGSLTNGGSATSVLIFNETPLGLIDNVNDTFTLIFTPNPINSLLLFKDGILQRQGSGNDYTITGSTITFEVNNIPQSYSILLATYQK